MPEPSPSTVVDGFLSFTSGVDSGSLPLALEEGQAAFAVNTTFRGGFPMNRGGFQKKTIQFPGDIEKTRFETGRFQGVAHYESDGGEGSLVIAVSGRLWQFFPDRQVGNFTEITISYTLVTTQNFAVPAIQGTVTVVLNTTANINPNYEILIGGSNYEVVAVLSATTLTVRNLDDVRATVTAGTIVNFWDLNPSVREQTWMFQAERWLIINDGQSIPIFFDGASSRRSNINGLIPELPAGRMGAYGWGRVWLSGTDGRTYFAGDLVGGPTGTPAFNRRDSVLKFTENSYLSGGGRFIVPGNIGTIQGMTFPAVLDSSLGQGPLQILTPRQIFSCNTPINRTEWAAVENPIQTISQVTSGTTSQWSITPVNGDIFYRAPDGIRSLVLGRREFNTWGNTPMSREMNRIMERDDLSLLGFASSALFDNRMLMTCSPVRSSRGVYHRGLIVLDFDVISSMRNKAPQVYDGLWTGLQVLQIVTGQFSGIQRCFAVVLNDTGVIEIWEVLRREQQRQDNASTPIVWSFETGSMFKQKTQGGIFAEKVLSDGEIYVDQVLGQVDFQVFFRPDQKSCWTEWHRWSICANNRMCEFPASPTCVGMIEPKPQNWTRMGLGSPPLKICDPVAKKPYAQGHTFQFKIQVQGQCRVLGGLFSGTVVPEPAYAPKICTGADCFPSLTTPTTAEFSNTAQSYTAQCPEGYSGYPVTVTIPAGTIKSTISQADANAIALSAAQQQAEASLQCDTPSLPCWIESLATTTWRIQSFDPADFSFTGSVPADNPWDGSFPTFTDVDPNYKLWEADPGVTINGYEVYAFCDFNGCDEGGNRIWTCWILDADLVTQIWTGTKTGGTSPSGTYTRDGGSSPGPATLIIEQLS
jgi:hypothetical protein